MWDLPGPGLEPVSPALSGGFLTTAPPGKPSLFVLNVSFKQGLCYFFRHRLTWNFCLNKCQLFFIAHISKKLRVKLECAPFSSAPPSLQVSSRSPSTRAAASMWGALSGGVLHCLPQKRPGLRRRLREGPYLS